MRGYSMMKRWSRKSRRGAAVQGASLVVASLLACSAGAAGCKNDRKPPSESSTSAVTGASASASTSAAARAAPTSNTVRREAGDCLLLAPGGSGALTVDCPPGHLEPGDPAPAGRRPRGKESWIRVRPWIYFEAAKGACAYTTESFCSPPGTFAECTPAPKATPVPCTRNVPAGTLEVASFVYVDGTGACHKVPATTCKANARGLCDLPEGEVVACEGKGSAPAR